MQGKTHGVVKFLLLIKMNDKSIEFFDGEMLSYIKDVVTVTVF